MYDPYFQSQVLFLPGRHLCWSSGRRNLHSKSLLHAALPALIPQEQGNGNDAKYADQNADNDVGVFAGFCCLAPGATGRLRLRGRHSEFLRKRLKNGGVKNRVCTSATIELPIPKAQVVERSNV